MRMDISNVSNISFDFDGVFLRHFLNKHWVSQSEIKEKGVYKKGPFHRSLDSLFSYILFLPRREIKGSKDVLSKLSDKNVYLVTSRRDTTRDLTKNWLEERGLLKYFKELYFNPHNLTPYLFKEEVIKTNNIRIHVDDDFKTVDMLSKRLNDVTIIYFNSMNTPKIDRANVIEIKNWKELDELFKKTQIIEQY